MQLSDLAAIYGLTTEQVKDELHLRSIGPDARMQEFIGKASADLEALHPHEWNFDAVTDPAELAACCCWEYARESPSIRRIRAQFEYSPTALNEDIDRVLSIGALAKILFMYPESLFQFGARAFPHPWQSLPPRRRQELAKIAASKPAAFKVENSVWVANCLAHHANALVLQTAQRRHEQELEWQRVLALAKVDPLAAKRTIEQGKQERVKRNENNHPFIRWSDGGETLILTVNWTHRNLQELADEFLKWAKRIRPHDLRKPNGNTSATPTLRADLARLAVWRLLSVYSPKQLLGKDRVRVRDGKLIRNTVTPPIPECVAVWQSKQFKGDKWLEVEKWRDARREARLRFRELFPFLPKSEKPLSDQRRK